MFLVLGYFQWVFISKQSFSSDLDTFKVSLCVMHLSIKLCFLFDLKIYFSQMCLSLHETVWTLVCLWSAPQYCPVCCCLVVEQQGAVLENETCDL